MLHHEPLYRDVLYGGWFDTITLILWPNSFYLKVMVAKEPAKVAFAVWSIAVLLNPPICAPWMARLASLNGCEPGRR